jgi:hypothetical protein
VTRRQLRSICSYWQRELRLMDWVVNLRFVYGDEIVEDGHWLAQVSADNRYQEAWLDVLHPKKRPEHHASDEDLEKSIVHELLHIKFSMWKEMVGQDDECFGEELAVNHIAELLVRMRHSKAAA